jgi:hypothetical protein
MKFNYILWCGYAIVKTGVPVGSNPREVEKMKGKFTDKLCAIDDTGKAAALSSQPLFSCSKCGAKSHDANSVCSPIELPSG